MLKCHLNNSAENPGILVSLCDLFLVLIPMVVMFVPQTGTPTWRAHTKSSEFLKIIISIPLLSRILVEPGIVLVNVVSFYPLFTFFEGNQELTTCVGLGGRGSFFWVGLWIEPWKHRAIFFPSSETVSWEKRKDLLWFVVPAKIHLQSSSELCRSFFFYV